MDQAGHALIQRHRKKSFDQGKFVDFGQGEPIEVRDYLPIGHSFHPYTQTRTCSSISIVARSSRYSCTRCGSGGL